MDEERGDVYFCGEPLLIIDVKSVQEHDHVQHFEVQVFYRFLYYNEEQLLAEFEVISKKKLI